MRSDKGAEFYGRYTESEEAPGPFAKFLEEHGIVAQYTMPALLVQNDVAERWNKMLRKMVQTIIKYSVIHIYLWDEAIKTAAYILNKIPTKTV